MSFIYKFLINQIHPFYKLNKSMNNINKDKGYVYNFFVSVNIVLNLLYDKYYVKRPSSSIKMFKDRYMISYSINGKKYKIVIPRKKNINKIIKVVNEYGNDITIEFETYLGPCNNFHGFEYTPYTLGYDKIIIETINCECIVFNKYDIITL